MIIYIINTDYLEFLDRLYRDNPELCQASYGEQQRARTESLFGGAGFLARALQRLGHEAEEIYANNYAMQSTWMREHGYPCPPERNATWELRRRMGILPWPTRRFRSQWQNAILLRQIQQAKPDVVLIQAMDVLDSNLLKEIRPWVKVLIGQHAAMPLQPDPNLRYYDFCISSFPPTVDWFRAQGVPARMQSLGFPEEVLEYFPQRTHNLYDVTFIGSLLPVHQSRRELLEYLADRVPLSIWGPPHIAELPSLKHCYLGPAYGREMFQILADSKMTINHHGSIPPYANNFRLYESTGLGTALVTDWKANLGALFTPEEEVITYRDATECCQKIQHYLENEPERTALAQRGQQRTLSCHTYQHRMAELIEMVKEWNHGSAF